jgi:hypothetical protein
MRLLITLVLFSYISIAETITGTEGVVLDGFVSSPTPSSQAALNQYLILSSEFPEDLELIVENGYPTPEIREILTDESIPKEDRYWLDCRMRSKIAQILHRFYSENGDIIDIEADWVAPGEDYWQEIMMVSSSRGSFTEDVSGPHWSEGSGLLYNLNGDKTGQLAVASESVRLSRDGSIGVLQTGPRSRAGSYTGTEMYFCFLYPDGSYREVEIEETYLYSDMSQAVSQDGSISAWNMYNINNWEESYLVIYDRNGSEIRRTNVPYSIRYIKISPNNEFIAFSGSAGGGLLNRNKEELLTFTNGEFRIPMFSSNSLFCSFSDGWISGYSSILDLQTGSNYLFSNVQSYLPNTNSADHTSISNTGHVIAIGNQIYFSGKPILSSSRYESSAISPNGYFVFLQGDSRTGVRVNQDQFSLFNLQEALRQVE